MGDIKICPNCKGEGTIIESICFNDFEVIRCERCKGSGRIYERTYILEIPFNDKNDRRFYSLDKTILDSIQELRKSLT